jgi:hypothetical protein
MPSVGGQSVTFLHGEVAVLKRVTRVYREPGHDGYGMEDEGLGAGEFAMVVEHFAADKATMQSVVDAIEDLQGTIVTVVDAHGDSYPNCLLLSATLREQRNAPQSTGNEYLGVMDLQFVRVGTAS